MPKIINVKFSDMISNVPLLVVVGKKLGFVSHKVRFIADCLTPLIHNFSCVILLRC